MVRLCFAKILVFLIVADTVTAFIDKTKLIMDDLKSVETRRKGKDRSTSSDEHVAKSGDKDGDESDDRRESLDVSSEGSDSKDKQRNKKYRPKSSLERSGWRKWHRKCSPCPDDIGKAWRDPGINWVCGGYQRARRSFKSTCMMRYRNCQDGTMFVFLHYHRCDNDTGKLTQPFGRHFFYDYKVNLMDDDSSGSGNSDSTDATTDDSGSGSSSDARRRAAPVASTANHTVT